MGATVISSIAVFTHNPVSTPVASDGLFASDDPLVVVFRESYEKNLIPHTPKWSLDYVGSMALFNAWVEESAGGVENGNIHFRSCSTASGFRKLMKAHLSAAKPLTPAVMARYRQRFSSIPVEIRPMCGEFMSEEIEFDTSLGARVGMVTKTPDQIAAWLADMVQLQNAHVAIGKPFYASTVWNESYVPDATKVF